jgi:hypothetical protein
MMRLFVYSFLFYGIIQSLLNYYHYLSYSNIFSCIFFMIMILMLFNIRPFHDETKFDLNVKIYNVFMASYVLFFMIFFNITSNFTYNIILKKSLFSFLISGFFFVGLSLLSIIYFLVIVPKRFKNDNSSDES